MLTVGSLFSGIGGLDLGLERAGMSIRWQSEIDPYACKILKKHWSEVPNHGDIKRIDWRTVEPVDVICGGYPCQPFSTAGKRRGTDDPRHLWPWVRDAISAVRPRYAILENVRGHLSMGGTTVIGELAEIGYDAEWRVVSAAGLGAPHRRDRIIIVAYPDSSNTTDGGQRTDVQGENRGRGNDRGRSGSDLGQIGLGSTGQNSCDVANANNARKRASWGDMERQITSSSAERVDSWHEFGGCSTNVANTCCKRCQKSVCACARTFTVSNARRSSLECGSFNGWWETEPNVGRVADGVSSRLDRLRGLGNAVVPQVAEYIGRLVMAAELDNA